MTTPPLPELLGCPFCGAEAGLTEVHTAGFWRCVCTSCHVGQFTQFDDAESSIKEWNKRAALAAPLPEPVATVIEQGNSKFPMFTEAGLDLPAGTPLYTAPIAAAQDTAGKPEEAVAPQGSGTPVAAAAPLPQPPEHWAPVMFRLMEAASHALAGNEFEVGRDQLFVAYKEAKALDPLGVMLRHRGTESDLTARPATVCSICWNPSCEGTHAAPPDEMQTHAAHWVNETERPIEAMPRPVPTPSVRIELVVALHTLAGHFENALYKFQGDAEALKKAEGDIAHARKVAAKHNQNGPT